MPRYDLPGGQTVDLRDGTTLRNRDRKTLLIKADQTKAADTDVAMGIAASEQQIAMLVEGWSLELPLPKDNIAVLDELDIATADALQEACKSEWDRSTPDFSATPEADSPTEPSSG